MKKYFSPEYANEVVMSNDIVTTSVYKNDITPAGANYTMYENITVDAETHQPTGESTVTVIGNVSNLLGI